MSGILFVTPGPDAEREVFRDEGRGLWSAALPVVLEKHGYLNLETASPEALADPERLVDYDVVLVARGRDDPWANGALRTLREHGVALILDGPPTLAARAELGLGAGIPITGTGAVHIRDPTLRAAAERFGMPLGGRVAMPDDAPAAHVTGAHWSELPSVPITAAQAAAWGVQPWDAEGWPGAAGGVLMMDWVTPETGLRTPAVVRWDSVVACSFGLFAFLAYMHTSAPTARGRRRVAARSAGIEVALLGIIDLLHRQRGAVRARVRPWPAGVPWVASVRHDATQGGAEVVGAALAADPSPATWACAPESTTELAAAAAAAGQEVALLAQRPWGDSAEVEALAAACGGAERIVGTVTSRAAGAFGFQGVPNVLWAQHEGFRYAELLGHGHLHPHRFPALSADGGIVTLAPICLPEYENLDAVTADRARLTAAVDLWSDAAGLMQLRSDPGPRVAERLARLGDADLRGAARWTLAGAAAWWGKTHDGSTLTLRALGEGRFAVRAAEPVEGLTIELLHPDGSVTEHVTDVGTDEVIVASGVREAGFPIMWEETWEAYERAWALTGGDVAAAWADGSAPSPQASPAAVAMRGEVALELLSRFAGRTKLTDTVILDLGSGHGAGTCYLAWRASPELVVGVDSHAGLIRSARDATAELGFDRRLRFMLAATTDLRELPDASVDVAIADGSLPAAAGTRQLRRALAEVHRVVVPGGLVLVRQVNRPRSLALRMRGALRHAGFRELRMIGYAASERHLAGWRRHLDPTFAIVARRPGEPVIRAELPAASSPRGRPPRGRPPLRVAFPEEVSAVFAHHVRGHLRERGVAAASAARTVRINSTLAPERARQLLELLRQHLGIMSLEDRRVLELGCGFGALAAQLAILDRPASIVAVDNDERQLTVARACVQELGLAPPVDVRRLDMRSLEGIEVGSIELALVNNAFPYLPTAADADRALAEIARVLAPGAGVLFYHANRWRLTEPFTGAPLLHLLPPAIGKPLSAVTRLRLSHGRVRLLSAAELRRRLREVGLEPAGTTGFLRGPRTAPVVRELGTYYAVAARKPQQ